MANTVNQPDGSSVTNTQPPGAAAAAAASVWTVEYEVDFTDQGVYDFRTTGTTRTIGGATWTAVNRTATDADVFDFDGSTGLRINAKAGPTNNAGEWFNATQTQPYFWATLDDMVTSSALAEDDTLCLQLEMTTTADVSSNYHRYGLGLWKNDAPGGADNFICVSRFHNNAAYSASIAKTTEDNVGSLAQPDFFEIVSYPNGSQVVSCGVIGGGNFPDPLATTTYKAYNALNDLGPGDSGGSAGSPSWKIPFAKAAFVITCQVKSSTTALNSTSAKMRLLRRNKS